VPAIPAATLAMFPAPDAKSAGFAGFPVRGRDVLNVGRDQTRLLLILSDTGARPLTPRTRAAPGLRSITRPRTYGPRSLIRTVAERPLRWLMTVTMLPNGRVLCAAVMALGFMCSPVAVTLPW
jgi:hypothetical protein